MQTIRRAAVSSGIPERALRRLVRERKVPVTRVGNRAYISEEWLKSKLERDGTLERQ